MCPEEIAAVDACAAALCQQSYGAAFSRAEALRIAAMEWLKERQGSHLSVTSAPPPRAGRHARERASGRACYPRAWARGPPPPASRRTLQSSGADPGGPHGRGDAGA